VPLDWSNTSNPIKTPIAFIKLPAEVNETDLSHSGSIFINPGGPGGSGIDMALQRASELQARFKGPQNNYEIVSFDTRGTIRSSSMKEDCISDDIQPSYYKATNGLGEIDKSDYMLNYAWEIGALDAKFCLRQDKEFSETYGEFSSIKWHLSTASVAADIVYLLDAIDEERQQHLNKPKGVPIVKKSKLQYYGISYGSFIGTTFANMYPERVGRLILDSNVDANGVVMGLNHDLVDTDRGVEYFAHRCFEGQSACAVWQPSDAGPEDVLNRINQTLSRLRKSPVFKVQDDEIFMFTASTVEGMFFGSLYNPIVLFPDVATKLNLIDATEEIPITNAKATSFDSQMGVFTLRAIQCSDGPDYRNSSLESFREFAQRQFDMSKIGGAISAEGYLPCWRWPFRPRFSYSGPFNASIPILFSNFNIDPVTPLMSAVKMAEQHKGSALIEVSGAGHGTLDASCVWPHFRRYMHSGKLPKNGTKCDQDCEAFDTRCLAVSRFTYPADLYDEDEDE